jgi:hypothetical protein
LLCSLAQTLHSPLFVLILALLNLFDLASPAH